MAKRTTRFLLIFLGLLLLPSGLYSQISKIAKKSYPKFVELLPQTDTSYTMCDSVINIGTAIFNAEQAGSDSKMDTLFLAKFCKQMADVYVKNLDYSNATLYFLLSANYYQKIRDDLNAGNSISNYLLYYEVVRLNRMKNNNWRYIDSTIFDHGNADTTIWFTAKARSLTWSDKRDTLFVTINAGKAQNIVEGSKFDVFTTFDTFYAINRSVIQAGTGFITHIDNFTADGFIVINEGFNDTIFDNDAYEVKINVDKRFVGSQTAELGAFNIKFTDHLSNVYFVGGDGNLTINNSKFEKPLKVVMLQSMHDAIAYYDTSNPGVMETLIETGPFAGSTYRQCFKASRLYDLELFLDYIIAYPSKNINREFNLVSKYATWVINDCWLGNKESMVIDSLFLTPEKELLARSQYWGGLYKQVTKTDSVLLKQIKDVYELNPQKRIVELNKLHKLAIATKNEKSDSFYSVNLLYEYYGVKDYNKALEYADRVWPKLKGWDKQLIALYKGVQFSNLHRSEEAIRFLDSSLAIDTGYYYAKGYKGWNLLKMGRIKQAIPYCQYSWNYDSFVPWTNINYAHALILKGDKNEAKRLYRKSFEYMTVESDFKEGLLTDFDYFISTGLNETEFKELREEFNNYYLRSWKNRIVGDSLKARSLTYEGKEKYDEGIRLMVAATKEYFKDPKPNWEKVRNTYRWTGYMHYKKKDYNNSVVYYKKAAGVSIAAGLGDDNLISDYDDVANIYDWLDDTLHEMEFRSRASSLEVALREKRDQKRLYMLCIGPNTANKNDSFSQADASVLSTAMKTGADLHFDSVTNHTFLGKNATLANIKNALDSAIYTLGENDVFMFYFSGYGQTGATEGIQLSDGLLPMRDLSGYLSQVPAGRQIHIADCNGLNWREWYQRGNFSQLSSEKRSLMFFGLKNARIEERILNHSVLSNALIKSLETSLEDGVATATEWFSHAAATMFDNDQLYALEMQAFGHDFTIGKAKVALKVKDTFPPLIELFGAVATRGENISLVSNKSVIAGRITDNNNITFAAANGITLTIAQNGRFELPKELVGVRNISIVAVDEFGNRNQKDFLVTQSETAKTSESTRYAYLFASKDYEFWDDLTNPIFDAEKIGELLESNYGFQTTIIRNPDRYKITEKLDEIRRFKYKSNDQVFVFFAGHGLYDSVWGGYYVCPESKKPAQDKYYETYYPQQKIADLLDGCNAGNVFLVMDVCFGGKMFDKVDKHEYRSVNDGNELSSDEYVRRQLEIRCRQFLTSGGNNYVEDGVAGTHSPFASRVIYALEEAATKKDYLSASEMMDYLRTMKTMGNDKKSFPRYGFFGGDKDGEFVFKVTRKIRNSATIAGL